MFNTHTRAWFWAFLLQPIVLAGVASTPLMGPVEEDVRLIMGLGLFSFAMGVVAPAAIAVVVIALVRRRLSRVEGSVSFVLILVYVVIGLGGGVLRWPPSLGAGRELLIAIVTYVATAACFIGLGRVVNLRRREEPTLARVPLRRRVDFVIGGLMSGGLVLLAAWFIYGERQWRLLPEPRRFNHQALISVMPLREWIEVDLGNSVQSDDFDSGLRLKGATGQDTGVVLAVNCSVSQGLARKILARTVGADAGGQVMLMAHGSSNSSRLIELTADGVPVTEEAQDPLWLDIDALLRLTRATRVSGSVGGTAFVWTEEQLEAFRDFASRVRTLRVGS
jgi:hypothetical protein